LLAGLTVLAACGPGRVGVDDPEPSGENAAACAALIEALPESVADQLRRSTEPADAPAAAWGNPPIVLTCGVGAPKDFTPESSCLTVNGVDWHIPEEQLDSIEKVDLTMTVVNRAQHVEVVLPHDYAPPAATLADLAKPIKHTIKRTGRCR
jgi:hypothetical protein